MEKDFFNFRTTFPTFQYVKSYPRVYRYLRGEILHNGESRNISSFNGSPSPHRDQNYTSKSTLTLEKRLCREVKLVTQEIKRFFEIWFITSKMHPTAPKE